MTPPGTPASPSESRAGGPSPAPASPGGTASDGAVPVGAASCYARANAGPEAHRWQTFPDTPVVLALARTFTSAVRVLEALAVFRGDTRVRVLFAFDGTSAFNAGTETLLEGVEAGLIPWSDRLAVGPDLVVTATENADMAAFDCPVVVLPHGIGFQKYVPDHRTRQVRLSGVPRPEFHDADNIHLVLSHPAQREQLRAARIPLAEHAQVVGDPAHDRLVSGLRLRDHYRSRLGVRPDQRLVVTTSTWGPGGLLGSRPRLPGALLGALPHDDYRVAAVVHPNVWFAHSPWQVRHMLADALDAGLLLMPPEAGWGAALVSADCVIGDHGSVTLYGAALDHPMLLGALGEESVPGTAVSELVRTAPWLAQEGLRAQVEQAIDTHVPGQHREAADLAFAHKGRGGQRLTELLYRLLGVAPPEDAGHDGTQRALPQPEPDPSSGTPRAFEVHGWAEGVKEVVIERFPAAAREVPDPPPGAVRHLSVFESEKRHALANSASVVCREPDRDPGSAGWLERALELHVGAFASAEPVPEGTAVLLRDGRRFLVRSEAGADPVLAAAVLYTAVRARLPLRARGEILKVRTGSARWECVIESRAAG
ncbi:hypothetical protein [Nocardiopsis valliformis]|uniref:hypothetical protein n=1 Tax=Nocardiopsis valliformis TaxID=239974 RepID=UPI001EF9EF16|nr:hypothetical protein [Nocardiopsis valliformis]